MISQFIFEIDFNIDLGIDASIDSGDYCLPPCANHVPIIIEASHSDMSKILTVSKVADITSCI